MGLTKPTTYTLDEKKQLVLKKILTFVDDTLN